MNLSRGIVAWSLVVMMATCLIGCAPQAQGCGRANLPNDFPCKAVPLVGGDVHKGATGSGQNGDGAAGPGWAITIVTGKDPEATYQAAISKLEAAGFTPAAKTGSSDPNNNADLTSADYDVQLIKGPISTDYTDPNQLTYAVVNLHS
jgi:hypothetical protein